MMLLPVCLTLGSLFIFQDPPDEEQEEVVEEVVEDTEATKETELESEEEEAVPEENPYFAIVGGEIHTVTDGVVHAGTVLCKNGRILKVGENIRIPEGATLLKVDGLHVYPGLIAADSSGVVSGRGSSLKDSFDPFSLNLDLGLSGGLTSVVSGKAVVKLSRGTLEGFYLGEVPWVSLNVSPSSPSARRQLLASLAKARDHIRALAAWKRAKEDGEEDAVEPSSQGVNPDHLALLRKSKVARFRAETVRDLGAVCDLLEIFPMDAVIFGCREAWTLASRLGRSGARVVVYPRSKSWANPALNRASGWNIQNARILHDAGVEVCILPSSATISTGGMAGRDLLTLPLEAAFAIRGGLSEEAALRAVTLAPARLLRMDDRLGSVEVGKDADLIITDRSIFDYRSFVQWAVVSGKVVYDKKKASYFSHIRPLPAQELAEKQVEETIDE